MKVTKQELIEMVERSKAGVCVPIKTDSEFGYDWIRIEQGSFLHILETYQIDTFYCEQDFPEINSTIYLHTPEYPPNAESEDF